MVMMRQVRMQRMVQSVAVRERVVTGAHQIGAETEAGRQAVCTI